MWVRLVSQCCCPARPVPMHGRGVVPKWRWRCHAFVSFGAMEMVPGPAQSGIPARHGNHGRAHGRSFESNDAKGSCQRLGNNSARACWSVVRMWVYPGQCIHIHFSVALPRPAMRKGWSMLAFPCLVAEVDAFVVNSRPAMRKPFQPWAWVDPVVVGGMTVGRGCRPVPFRLPCSGREQSGDSHSASFRAWVS